MRKVMALVALGAAVIGGTAIARPTADIAGHVTTLVTWDTVDYGAYAAPTIVHYSSDWPEDMAGDACDERGGSLTDDAAEYFVCVID